MNPRVYDILILVSLIGMICCIGYQFYDTSQGYSGFEERTKFVWWFYFQGGKDEVNAVMMTNTLLPHSNFQFYDINSSARNAVEGSNWREIAKMLYEQRK